MKSLHIEILVFIFRLKNIQIGYSRPGGILDDWEVDGLRIYASASKISTVRWHEEFLLEVSLTGDGSYSALMIFRN